MFWLVSHDAGEHPRFWTKDGPRLLSEGCSGFSFLGWPPNLSDAIEFPTREAAQEAAKSAGIELNTYTYVAEGKPDVYRNE